MATKKKTEDAVVANENVEKPASKAIYSANRKAHHATSSDAKIDEVIANTGSRSAAIRDARQRSAEREREQAIRAKKMTDWMAIKATFKMGRSLNGVVIATQSRALRSGGSIVFAVATCENTDFQALIPFHEFYREDPIQPDDGAKGSLERRQEQMLAKHMGAPISFVITDLDTRTDANGNTTYGVIASRRQALAKQDQRTFASDPPYIVEGMVTAATILSVSQQGLLVNLGGVDVRMSKREVSNRYMRTMDDTDRLTGKPFYSVGDKLDVKVMKVIEREDGLHDLQLSGAHAELQNIIDFGPPTEPGTTTIATLTRIFPSKTDKSKATIYAYSDSFNLPIVISRFSPTMIRKRMVPGDTILVQIIAYHENGFAFALCKGLM